MLARAMDAKERAARAALDYLHDHMVIGLGTGSTADFFLIALAEAIRSGRFKNVRGLPTSRRSEIRAQELGIPLTNFSQSPHPDLTVDGADEIAPNLDLIKGLGGALLREKIVAQNSRLLIIIADAGKIVARLGSKASLPVEVAPFGHETHAEFLRSLGCVPTLRTFADNRPFVTDNANYIYDCKFNGIEDAQKLNQSLRSRAGCVESGLFLQMAAVALVGYENDIRKINR